MTVNPVSTATQAGRAAATMPDRERHDDLEVIVKDDIEVIVEDDLAVEIGAAPGEPAGGRGDQAGPVFVVGGRPPERARLRALLDSHPAFSCGPENELLADLTKAIVNGRDCLAHHGFPEAYWFASIARYYDSIQSNRLAKRDKRRWVEFVAMPLGTLDRLFPRCRFVHLVDERGTGRLRAGAVRRAAARLSTGRYHEVPAAEFVGDAGRALRGILDFLGEDSNDGALTGRGTA